MACPVFLINELAGHSWAANFCKGFNIDNFFMEKMAEEKHRDDGEDTSTNYDVWALFHEDIERLEGDGEHLWNEEDFFAIDLGNAIFDIFVFAVIFRALGYDENVMLLAEWLQHEQLFKMTSGGGDEADFLPSFWSFH